MQFLLVLCFFLLVILVSLSSSNKLQILQSHDFFVTSDLQLFCVYEN